MFSEMAKHDLAMLRQNGFNPTDEQIVKLNDLALRIERGKDTTPTNHPRIGLAGNVVLHEPTIGGKEWFYTYGRDACMSAESKMNTYYFMLANCRENLDFLNSLRTTKDILVAVKKWMKNVGATQEELFRASLWAQGGVEGMQMDVEELNKRCCETPDILDSLWNNIMAYAGALQISPDDLKTLTQSEINGMMMMVYKLAGINIKQSVAELYIRYQSLLHEIEQSKKSEDETNGEQ